MAEIKELSDDELASVVGGVGEGNAKYPVGTKFVRRELEPALIFIEITNVYEASHGIMMYNFIMYITVGTETSETQSVENIPESYFNDILADGTYSIYNG